MIGPGSHEQQRREIGDAVVRHYGLEGMDV
jgi:hypothetical protein